MTIEQVDSAATFTAILLAKLGLGVVTFAGLLLLAPVLAGKTTDRRGDVVERWAALRQNNPPRKR